jgi:hypothetical protein
MKTRVVIGRRHVIELPQWEPYLRIMTERLKLGVNDSGQQVDISCREELSVAIHESIEYELGALDTSEEASTSTVFGCFPSEIFDIIFCHKRLSHISRR